MVPVRVAACATPVTVAPCAAIKARLEQISERQIIVVVQSRAGTDVSGAVLGYLKRRQNVRRELIDQVASVNQIAPGSVRRQIGSPVAFQSSIEVQRHAGRGKQSNLAPPACSVYRNDRARRQHRRPLPQAAQTRSVLALEKGPGE